GGSSNSGQVASQFDDQIAAAQAKVNKDPKDQHALATLAKYQYFKGQAELGGPDPDTGAQFTLTDSAHADLGAATDTWARYLKVAKKPDPGTAQTLVNAYVFLNDAKGAAETQKIVVAARPSAGSYNQLAFFLYADGKVGPADAAAKKAVAMSPASQRKTLQQQFAKYHDQAVKFVKAQKKQSQAASAGAGANPLANPFGSLGGSSGSTSTP